MPRFPRTEILIAWPLRPGKLPRPALWSSFP
jgi:hypothetical protein